jgi:haloacid dehalogenase-like hydrolase
MTASSKPGFTPSKETYSAGFTLLAILLHLLLKFGLHFPPLSADIPLFAAPLIGGVPLVWALLKKLVRREFRVRLAGRRFDERYAAAIRFHDAPRKESVSFIQHLQLKHGLAKVMLLPGDRASEVNYLAKSVGITEVHAGKSPEQKVAIELNAVRVALPTRELRDY